MDPGAKRLPKRKEDRIILQFDYDCFYAQVFENKQPELKAKPLGVKQKSLLATCNYHARRRGVKKLMLVSEARRICPDLVLVDGEDLTPFRDTSKLLFHFLRSHSWSGRAERLGFDEVFLDVTDVIEYNVSCLSPGSLAESFFHLSRGDPELGFPCDPTSVVGCVAGSLPFSHEHDMPDPAYLRLALASHLAQHLRLRLEHEFGYTSTCGVATNKTLSKLVGAKNKPRNQTTLLALADEDVAAFMDEHRLGAVPGLGARITQALESHIQSEMPPLDPITVRDVRLHPSISPAALETLLGGPGVERGIGHKIWGLLHGVDPTPVKEAGDVPAQISIEDTYRGLETLPRITEELHKLSCSLVRRMRADLVAAGYGGGEMAATDSGRWIARPKTLRLSIRPWSRPSAQAQTVHHRTSRSTTLPGFVFDLKAGIDEIAGRLVAEALLPLLRRLQADKGRSLQLINICVANMVVGAADDGTGVGRDIGEMFKRQDEVLRPWRVVDEKEEGEGGELENIEFEEEEDELEDIEFEEDGESPWKAADSICSVCGFAMPEFAMAVHARYHELGA